jgi:glycosyltransferase involved in cell wall biosynthesis
VSKLRRTQAVTLSFPRPLSLFLPIHQQTPFARSHIDSLWRLPGASSYTSGGGSGGPAGVTGRVAVSPSASSPGGGGSSSAADAAPSLSSSTPLEPDATRALLAPLARGCGARRRPAARIVYPPCNTDALSQLPLAGPGGSGDDGGVSDGEDGGDSGVHSGGRERIVVSVGQFRPEKDHPLQLRAFAAFRARDPARFDDVRLVLIGGCRGAEDEARVAALKALATTTLGLRVPEDVQFVVNAPLGELRGWLGRATAGLHTMW